MDDFGSCVIVVHLFELLLGRGVPPPGAIPEDTYFDPFEQDSFLAIHDVDVSRSELVQKSDSFGFGEARDRKSLAITF